jgi:hypothetical protein
MARGPFQGTWQEGLRPTVVTAPDAIVYINGQPDMMACSDCRRRFDLNKYITSIQVDLSIDNSGSASVNLSIPRHTVDDFYVDGVPIVSPMMEIEIYAKGYYLVGGVPQYYPIFWGLVTEVSDSYSGGEHTVSISCADILKWWDLCRLNINAAYTQPAGQLGRDYITGNVFNGANVYDIIWTLAQQSFGDIVQAKGSLVTPTREAKLGGAYNGVRRDIMSYWNTRFGQMRSSLLLYGMEGAAVRGDVLWASQSSGKSPRSNKVASSAVRNANGGPSSTQVLFDTNTNIPFRSNISNSGQVNFWQSEYQTKMEIANTCKEAVGFEFFMDVTGDIVFKPPFYNLDILGNKPISWIQDIDIIDWNLSESEAEVVTQLQMSGSFDGGPMDHGVTSDFNTPTIQVTDYHLLRQYGWRPQSFNAEFLNSPEAMFYVGLDMLDHINAKRHRSSVTIPLRPELRLGFPVYLAPKDQIWYLTGVSHSLTFGGRAQTQLTLTARRGKFIAPKGIGTIELTSVKNPTTKQTAAAVKEQAGRDKVTNIPLVKPLKPTAKELSLFGKFKLTVGAAAETPPTNLEAKVLTDIHGDDPYAPLILRHPKTGRIVGYPNVNMAYTRPFNPDNATFRKLAGENQTPDKSKAERLRNQKDTTAAKENDRQVASGTTQTTERDLVDRHLDNRYIYGMTSAGVYTYVHDTSKVLQELIQIPIANIDVVSTDAVGTTLATRSGTATIRPVSDERGFEVIGHYLYGRGISLRDGSLVLSDDGRNNQAPVETQLALAGGLFQTLRAQSQGLTTLVSAYASPADVVSRMAPDDMLMQTAGMLNPETKEPQFVQNGLNFVDTAPLNSPANVGEVASIEASQLSRALTVSEMMVKEDVAPEDSCPCLMSRSDLAFINVGYQVQFLPGTAPDRTTEVQANIQRQMVDIQSSLVAVDRQIAVDPSASLTEQREALIERLNQLQTELNVTSGVINGDPLASQTSTLGEAVPIAQATTAKPGETLQRVERFLTDLYAALDEPHQAYEDALRGKLISGPSRSDIINSNEQTAPASEFSPPFSVTSRAIGGDPAALALQGSSAVTDLKKSWKIFGDNLRSQPERAALTRDIEQTQKKVQRLEAEEKRLQAVLASGSAVVSVQGVAGATVSEQLANVRAEKVQATQQLNNSTTKLRQLEAQ